MKHLGQLVRREGCDAPESLTWRAEFECKKCDADGIATTFAVIIFPQVGLIVGITYPIIPLR